MVGTMKLSINVIFFILLNIKKEEEVHIRSSESPLC